MTEFFYPGLAVSLICIIALVYFSSRDTEKELSKQIKNLSEKFDRIQLQLDYLTSTKGNIK